MRRPEARGRNHAPRGLWGIVGLAMAVRIAAAIYLGDTVTPLPGTYDQVSYHTLATRVLEGHGFSFGTGWWPATRANEPTAHWSFLYVLFLSGVYGIAGVHPLAARLVQAIGVGVLQPLLTYSIARRLFGTRVGLVSAAVVACYAYFVYYAAALLTEPLYILAILWSLDTALRIAERTASPGDAHALSMWPRLGFALAAAILLRQVILLVLPVVMAWLGWRLVAQKAAEEHWRRFLWRSLAGATAAALVVVACILPWTIRNSRVFGQFVLLNTNAGFAFYWGNHPIHGTGFMPIYRGGAASYRAVLPDELTGLNEAALDRTLMERGFRFVADDPARFLRLSVSRVKEYVKFWPSPESDRLSNLARVLSFGACLPFFVLGVVFATRKPSSGARDSRCQVHPGTWLLLGVALVYSLVHVVTWTLIRYRLPVDAVLMPLVGLSMVQLVNGLCSARAVRSLVRSTGASM